MAYSAALKALHDHRNGDIEIHLTKALKYSPNYAAALTMRELWRLSEQRIAEAAKDAHLAVRADSGYEAAYITLAAVENARHNFAVAESLIRNIASQCQSFWWIYHEWADSLIGSRRYVAVLNVLRGAGTQVTQQMRFFTCRAHMP